MRKAYQTPAQGPATVERKAASTRIESFLKDPRPAADNLDGARTPC